MYEKFGAIVDNGQVTFKLFLPDNQVDPGQYVRGGDPKISEIRVSGSFQHLLGGRDWDPTSAPALTRMEHEKGWLWTTTLAASLPAGFYEYKYFVTFQNLTDRWVTDPCTKYGGAGEHENSGFAVGGTRIDVEPPAQRLAPQDLIIYELMIDDFTAEYRGDRAPLDAVNDRLDYLQQLGVNAIEFMPWTAWPGSGFSWGYDPFQFFAVEYRYVNDDALPEDKIFRLKRLINNLHERGMQVIMDGVFNHVRAGIDPNKGFPYVWLYQIPEESPYIGAFERGGFFEEFDYDNGCVEEFIRDICFYWLDTYQLDGIRFDFTVGFFRPGDGQVGITKLLSDLRAHLADEGRQNVSLIVEHLRDNRYDGINDTNQMGATGCWFDPFMYELQNNGRSGRASSETVRILNSKMDFQADKWPVTYIENHDHSRVIANVGGRDRWFKTQAPAIVLFTSPGMTMIYNGQEFGEDYFMPEQGSGRVEPRPLRWEIFENDFAGQSLQFLYRKLAAIRRAHPALRGPHVFPTVEQQDGYGIINDSLVIFHRYGETDEGLARYIVVVNFSDTDQNVTVPFSTNGQWTDLLNGDVVEVADFRLVACQVASNWGRLFYQLAI